MVNKYLQLELAVLSILAFKIMVFGTEASIPKATLTKSLVYAKEQEETSHCHVVGR